MFSTKKYEIEIKQLAVLKNERVLSAERKARIKSLVLSGISSIPKAASVSFWHTKIFYFASGALALFFMVNGTVLASLRTFPGDRLYPIKIFKEQVEIRLAPTQSLKADLELRHAKARMAEFTKLNNQNNSLLPLPVPTITPSQVLGPSSTLIATGSVFTETQIKTEQRKVQTQNLKVKVEAQINRALEALTRERELFEKKGKLKQAEDANKKIQELTQDAFNQDLNISVQKQESGKEGEVRGQSKIRLDLKLKERGQEESLKGKDKQN